MSRAQLTSTVEQSSGGVVAPFLAGKNKIINGDFSVWQRGTSFSNPAINAYTADRIIQGNNASGVAFVDSQQVFTPGTAPVAGYESAYFYRRNVTTAGSGGQYNFIQQRIEDIRTLAGQTVTFSFWAKADSARTVSVSLTQNSGSGGTGGANFNSSNITLSTAWTRYSITTTLTSLSGVTIGTSSYLAVVLNMPINTTMTIDTWGWQVEAGSVATPFTTASGTLQGELALCQRYYQRINNNPSGYGGFGSGFASATTNVRIDCFLPVQMRALPSAIDYSTLSSTFSLFNGTAQFTPSAITYNSNESYVNIVHLDFTVSGATQYAPFKGFFQAASAGYIGFSAEL